ncbi:ROK family protein [Vibrio ichthyoenteri ATCC 700023]|uniref:ROK family protein n=1 Tax=Vibrio ichthyoenteri ATCC 700023 TaxID=870968 RepID=F9S0I9_9VIBR|nr:ROK family protein [Vibrio ichthyoenteri]EGU43276.1 ROK family protein [Vibrio ichthyoenteri ATCC 700023]
MSVYLALDFGGSSVKCAILDHNASKLEQFSIPSRVGSFDRWFEQFDFYFHRYLREYPLSGIAISACGVVDVETGYIHGQSALSYLHGVNVKQLFVERYQLPVELENDACCAALAEQWQGAGQNSEHFCLVVIGSGIGGAIVTNGAIQKGHHLHGGEFGYAIMNFAHGQPQILSHLASTHALVTQVARALDIPRNTLNGIKVFELYDQGDEVVHEVVAHWINYLATGLFNLHYTVDPEFIVLGGAISQRRDLVTLVNQKFEEFIEAMPYCHVRPKLLASRFGNDANLIGALVHFLRRQGISKG